MISTLVIIVPGLGYLVSELDELIEFLAFKAQVVVFKYDSVQAENVTKDSSNGTPFVSALSQFCKQLSDGSNLILLGHSFGGLLAHLVERQHSVEIAEMILIDPMTELQFSVLPPLLPSPATDEHKSLSDFRDFIEREWKEPSFNKYSIDIPLYLDLLKEPRRESNTNVTVVSANTFTHDSPYIFPEPHATRLQLAWLGLHRRLLSDFARSQLVLASNSNHYVHRFEPHVIIAQVNAAISRIGVCDA